MSSCTTSKWPPIAATISGVTLICMWGPHEDRTLGAHTYSTLVLSLQHLRGDRKQKGAAVACRQHSAAVHALPRSQQIICVAMEWATVPKCLSALRHTHGCAPPLQVESNSGLAGALHALTHAFPRRTQGCK